MAPTTLTEDQGDISQLFGVGLLEAALITTIVLYIRLVATIRTVLGCRHTRLYNTRQLVIGGVTIQ